MTSSLFLGGSVMAALIAGAIALFAPCCISVMLPAYFASSFQNRRVLIAMTFVFAAGIATIVLPIALGASLVRQLISGGMIWVGMTESAMPQLSGWQANLIVTLQHRGSGSHCPLHALKNSREIFGGIGPWMIAGNGDKQVDRHPE